MVVLSISTAPVDPRRAVAQELLTRLGPAASQYSPAQLAQAANTILARRQQTQPAAPSVPMPTGGLDTTQRADVTAVAPGAFAHPDPITQKIKDLGLGIAQQIGDGANAIRATVQSGMLGQQMTGNPVGAQAAIAQDVANMTPEQQQSVIRGAAFLNSAIVGVGAAKLIPAVPGIINKATQYLIGNALGGAVYGAVRPTEAGETRGSAIAGDAAIFGLVGASVDAVGAAALGKIPWHEPITLFPGSKQAAVAEGGQLAQDLAHATVTGRAPSTAAQKAPDALRNLTDEQLAARPLGQTPPLGESAASPLAQEHQLSKVAARMTATDVQQAVKKQAIDVAVAHTPTMQIATPEIQSAVADVVSNPPTVSVGDAAAAALRQADPDAHFAAHITNHVEIPPATQLPPLTGDIAPGSLPSLNIAQSLQFIAQSQERLDQIAAAAKAYRQQATQETLGRLGQAGFATRPVVTGIAGFGVSTLGDQVEDEHPALGSLLHTVGRLMETAAVLDVPGSFWAQQRWAKSVINSLDATVALTLPGARESADQIGNLLTFHATQKELLRRDLLKAFPTEASQRALAYIGGPNWNQNAHWESLTPTQQAHATAIVEGLHGRLAEVAQAAGVMGAAREHYMPLGFQRRWYEEEFQGNAGTAQAALSQTGGWAKNRVFPDLATAEDWVRSKGLDPEQVLNHNGVELVVNHFGSVMRALDNKTMTDAMIHLGQLQPKEELIGGTTAFTPNIPGWRDVKVRGWEDHRAPEQVATLLENMASGAIPRSGVGRWYDALSSLATRTVIYNRYIHGVNLVRANLFAGVGRDGYAAARDALQRGDPLVLDAAQHGFQALTPPIAGRGVEAFDRLLEDAGRGDLSKKMLGGLRNFVASSERLQEYIGATGLAAYSKEQAAFHLRHPEILPGSPAWETNMNRIGKYAADVAGRIPTWFRSAGAKTFMNRVFLAPQWLESRWNLMRKGLVEEPQLVLHGGITPADALYGKLKLRQLAWVVAGTAALSYALSGSAPVFNPQTGKFYAKTGLKDSNGNDIGFDPWAWGQDDLVLFGARSATGAPGLNPLAMAFNAVPTWALSYLNRKTSPAINIATQLKFGRDFRGRELSTPEAIENAGSNLGGLAQGAEFLGRSAVNLAQGQTPTAGEAVRGVATTGGLGGFSMLPSDQQVMLSAQAAKILGQYGVPANGERVWELTRLMMSDARRTNGRSAFGYLSGSYVANEQRLLGKQHPASWLWFHLKQGLGQLVQ